VTEKQQVLDVNIESVGCDHYEQTATELIIVWQKHPKNDIAGAMRNGAVYWKSKTGLNTSMILCLSEI